MKETLEVVNAILQDRIPEHIVAQSFYLPVPQVVKETLNETVGELRPSNE